ncbi:DUF4124 domain-containing protein [Pseudomonas sp. LS44]|uniref:DUF4124 domain-containing protein n=1 Tax=Pseudomonas sp. LS44 TaxID=1357074 RepID=UPI00215B431E|nr:DUF4124 domain-containing protein [Pseudomonas sp. LS44]UVE17025.1 DUF4124 domain-containing protein [Pseudomonas sp. LS44]
MRRMMLTGSLLFALSATAMASQVYKWVDDKGITHFGAQPPQGQAATSVNTVVPTGKSSPPITPPAQTADDTEQKAIDSKVKKEVAEQETERKKFCENTRINLAQLQNNPRLRVTEANGEVRRVDEDERQKRIGEAEKAIKDNCQ